MKVKSFTVGVETKRSKNYNSRCSSLSFVVEGDWTKEEAALEAAKVSLEVRESLLAQELVAGIITKSEFVLERDKVRAGFESLVSKLSPPQETKEVSEGENDTLEGKQ